MPPRLVSWLAAAVITPAGCATSTTEVIVPIDTAQAVSPALDVPSRAAVQVIDLRREVELERTTIGEISMGRIVLRPPEVELVRAVVQAKADEVLARRGVSQPQTVFCGIRAFDISTPATPLYWDIDTKIELVLRVRGKERTVSGMATERTYVWPSKQLIAKVTTQALQQVATDSEPALEELLAAR